LDEAIFESELAGRPDAPLLLPFRRVDQDLRVADEGDLEVAVLHDGTASWPERHRHAPAARGGAPPHGDLPNLEGTLHSPLSCATVPGSGTAGASSHAPPPPRPSIAGSAPRPARWDPQRAPAAPC